MSRGVLPQPESSSSANATRLVYVDRFAVRNRPVHERRHPHRDADATVAGRVGRDGRVAVDRIATGEVQRVVEGPERTGVEPDDLAVDREPPYRRERARYPCGGDRNDQGDSGSSDDVKHLQTLVHLDVPRGLREPWDRHAGTRERAPEASIDDAGAREAVHLLKGVDRVEHATVEGPGG